MTDPNLIAAILEENDFKKYIAALFVVFVIPVILSLITTIVKNKTNGKLIETIKESNSLNEEYIKNITMMFEAIYTSKFVEGTIPQISFAFRNRMYHDVYNLVQDTKDIIRVNHIDNIVATRNKIETVVKNIHFKSKSDFNCFERHSIPVGAYFNDNWIKDISDIIYDFIYNQRSNSNGSTYNYEVLRARLKTCYDTISNEFNHKINNN